MTVIARGPDKASRIEGLLDTRGQVIGSLGNQTRGLTFRHALSRACYTTGRQGHGLLALSLLDDGGNTRRTTIGFTLGGADDARRPRNQGCLLLLLVLLKSVGDGLDATENCRVNNVK